MNNSVMNKIINNSNDIISDNNFLFVAFENRLLARLLHIFEKYKIPMNKNILKRNLDENLINNLMEENKEIIKKYTTLISNYEKIINSYVSNNTKTEIIKKSTYEFLNKIKEKNNNCIPKNISNNFIEYINSIIYVYDNHELNVEIVNRINNDINEIVNEFNRNNYNFIIESINEVIKNIINNI